MPNYCAKHQQFYSDYCVYCGNPQEKKIAYDTTGGGRYGTVLYYCACDERKTHNACVIHGIKGQNPLAF